MEKVDRRFLFCMFIGMLTYLLYQFSYDGKYSGFNYDVLLYIAGFFVVGAFWYAFVRDLIFRPKE